MHNNQCVWTLIQNQHVQLINNIQGCEVTDAHPGYVQCQTTQDETPLSKIFRGLEEAKEVFQVESYILGQVNLENVFLDCIKNQNY